MSDLKFYSEEERSNALEAIDPSSSTEEDVDKIMNAEIVESDQTPEQQSSGSESDQTPEQNQEEKKEKTAESDQTPEQQGIEGKEEKKTESDETTEQEKTFTVTLEDLPEGDHGKYKTPGHAFKAFEELKGLTKKQADYIQKLQKENNQAISNLQSEIEKVKNRTPEVSNQQEKKEISNDFENLDKLQEKLDKVENQLDDEYGDLSKNLNKAMIQNIKALGEQISQTKNSLKGELDNIKQSKENENKQNLEAKYLEEQFQEMDEFAKSNEEYKLDKSVKEVEEDYLNGWGAKVCEQFWGTPPEKFSNGQVSDKGAAQVAFAVKSLLNGGHEIKQKCEVANIPTEPPKDINNYLKLCELADYKDAQGYNERGEPIITRKKYDSITKKLVADTFPTLQDAYNSRRQKNGDFDKQVSEAYKKGGEEIVNAIGKRDKNELSNNESGAENGKITQKAIDEMINHASDEDSIDKVIETLRQQIMKK